MKVSVDRVLLICCILPPVIGFGTGLLMHLPGSALLTQLFLSALAGGFLFLIAWRRFHNSDQQQQEATAQLMQVVGEDVPHHTWIDERQHHWAQGWNHMANAVCTALRTMQEAAAEGLEQQQLQETILTTMVEGVLVLDGERNILFLNPAARALLDLNKNRPLKGRPVYEATRNRQLLEIFNAPVTETTSLQATVEMSRSQQFLELSLSPFSHSDKESLVIVMRDVSELRRLERTRREFFNNVSHELKTPLTSIQCFAETLLDGGLEDLDHNRRMVRQIETQAHRLGDLIQDILRLGRIEAGYEKFDFKPINIADVIRDCVAGREPVAEAREVSLSINSSTNGLYVAADEPGLKSVIENLLNNSINYNRPKGLVQVAWESKHGGVEISIADSGIGISVADRDRIFERFFRVDQARSASSGGTGLGLAIVKHLVAVFRGRISVDSELGVGSTFRIWLPLCSPPESNL